MSERAKVELKVEAQDDGARADVVLGRRVSGLSRRVARSMGLEGRLRIDGHRARPSTRVHQGQMLELFWFLQSSPASPAILRVTEDFVYVDKPAGVHTHRLRPSDPPSLADAVATCHPECANASPDLREHGAIQRLDFGTSGVLAFARHTRAWEKARRALRDGLVEKLYLAICRPTASPNGRVPDADDPELPTSALPAELRPTRPPRARRIDRPIGPGGARGSVRVRDDGLPALTFVWPLMEARSSDAIVCLLRLQTGRRHQARVHLAHAGMPIFGDALYGHPLEGQRPLLHALRVDLSSEAFPGERPVDAPLPEDMVAFIANGRR